MNGRPAWSAGHDHGWTPGGRSFADSYPLGRARTQYQFGFWAGRVGRWESDAVHRAMPPIGCEGPRRRWYMADGRYLG